MCHVAGHPCATATGIRAVCKQACSMSPSYALDFALQVLRQISVLCRCSATSLSPREVSGTSSNAVWARSAWGRRPRFALQGRQRLALPRVTCARRRGPRQMLLVQRWWCTCSGMVCRSLPLGVPCPLLAIPPPFPAGAAPAFPTSPASSPRTVPPAHPPPPLPPAARPPAPGSAQRAPTRGCTEHAIAC
jgi:hypothetical protein